MFFEALIIAGVAVTAACVASKQIGDAIKACREARNMRIWREERDRKEGIWRERNGLKSSADLYAKK